MNNHITPLSQISRLDFCKCICSLLFFFLELFSSLITFFNVLDTSIFLNNLFIDRYKVKSYRANIRSLYIFTLQLSGSHLFE